MVDTLSHDILIKKNSFLDLAKNRPGKSEKHKIKLVWPDEDPSDESFVIESAADSIHLSTPPPPCRRSRTIKTISVPQKVCFMDLTQLDKFIKQLNGMRMCATQGCKGELTPVKVSTLGLGGAVSVKYNCNGCGEHESHFETSSKNKLYNTSDISMSVQVAFIVAGCTHTTYYKTL